MNKLGVRRETKEHYAASLPNCSGDVGSVLSVSGCEAQRGLGVPG